LNPDGGIIVIKLVLLLISKTIPDIQKAIELGRAVPAAQKGNCTASLPALLYLALSAHAARQSQDAKATAFLTSLGVVGLPPLVDLLGRTAPQRAENQFGTYAFEAFRIGSRQDLLTDDWMYFCDRFRRAASRRKKSPAALALVSVFREMADNVVSHAYENPTSPCRALAGYHVTRTGTCFSVVDDGQGFLRSLRRNPDWTGLKSDNQALDAVVSKQATSRVGEPNGGGFKQLFNGLLNLHGLVRLRSRSAMFTLRNAGHVWQREEADTHLIPGSQVTFLMDTSGNSDEAEV
jgi:hypothetical protein